MVFDQRPDELFASVVQRGLETFRNTIEGVSQVIRTGDQTVRELDDALTGSRPKFGETPQETFTTVLDMLEGTLVEAREKGSAAAPSVTQHAREILGRINAVEPAWRPGPVSLRTAPDIFRSALRDLRGSNSLIRLAQGQGSLTDLDGLSKWADDLKERLGQVKSPAQSTQVPAATEPTPKARKKKDTSPKAKPQPDDVRLALAVAEEMGDKKVSGWAQEFADGKISEAQWITRLTNHAAVEHETLDDVFARAEARVKQG